jgi:two-component system nitrogen regulation sensor histidine kinase NtrY
MVSDLTFPERRAGLRALSRPSQLAFGVAILAVLSVCVTYGLLTRIGPNNLGPAVLILLGLVNFVLALALAGLIGWRVMRLMATRRSGRAGARLHVRLVTWFAAIAVVPAIIVAVFASVTLNMGMQAWFSLQVKDALGSAENVAHQFMMTEARGITLDAGQIAESLARDPSLIDSQHQLNTLMMMEKSKTMTQDSGKIASFLF